MSHALATVLHRGRRPRVASREARSQKTVPQNVPSLTILEAETPQQGERRGQTSSEGALLGSAPIEKQFEATST